MTGHITVTNDPFCRFVTVVVVVVVAVVVCRVVIPCLSVCVLYCYSVTIVQLTLLCYLRECIDLLYFFTQNSG